MPAQVGGAALSGRKPTETTGLTYEAASRRLGVVRCDRTCVLRALDLHTRGYVTGDLVHWKERILTRRGLWHFLQLVAKARGVARQTRVEQIWFEATSAYDLGLELGVRFPREFASIDRARARAELAATGPGGVLPIDQETKERIERWARD